MTEQPTALRLADRLEGRWALHPEMQEAAAELRRLAAENELLRERHRGDNVEYTRVLTQRDALLTLVEKIRYCDMLDAAKDGTFWKREIDATIKAVEENT